MKTTIPLLLATILTAGNLGAQRAPSLLVLSKEDHTLAIVDSNTLKVVAKVPVGNDPHEVIASADGMTAFVTNYGFGAYNTLAVVDLVHAKALPSVDLGPLRGPHGLAFAGGKTWFTAEAAKAIGRYDPATHKVDWVMGTGQDRTHMIYVSPEMKQIVTTNVASGTVSILEEETVDASAPPPGRKSAPGKGEAPRAEMQAMPPAGPNHGPAPLSGGTDADRPRPATAWRETTVVVGDGPEGFDVSPDGKEVWVANAEEGTISIIDLTTKTVVGTQPAGVPGANRLKFTPDGKRVLVSMLDGPDLVVLDAEAHAEIKRLPIGHGAAGILIQPDGARAFVACTPDDYVAVVDLKTLQVVGHIDAGGGPDGLAWAVRR